MMDMQVVQMIIVGLVLVGVFIAFIRDWGSPDIIAMVGLVIVLATGVLHPSDLLHIFGNSAPITIGSMFILSAALDRTGVIETMGRIFIRLAGTSELRVLFVLIVMAAGLSAFVNNTPVVVVFLPIVIGLARDSGLKASRLLIPLSYAGMLGGTCTLIGSSTNLLINGMAAEFGLRPFGLFEFSKLGLLYAFAGGLYLLTIGRRLLPDRETLSSILHVEDAHEFIMAAAIGKESDLIGKTISETALSKIKELRIVEVRRAGIPNSESLDTLKFKANDQLLIKILSTRVKSLKEVEGIIFPSEQKASIGLVDMQLQESRIIEGVIGPHSSMVGRSLTDLDFRQKYGAIILALHRQGQNLQSNFKNAKLAFGDTLLVEGSIDGIKRLREEKDFVSLSEPKQRVYRRSKAPIVIISMLLVIVLSAFNILPIYALSMIAAVAVVMLGCLKPDEAYAAVDWKILFLIFGMLGIGFAVERTGGAALLAGSLLGVIGETHPIVVLSVVYLITVLITELISNNATAVLLTPLVLQLAIQMDLDPRPLLIAVMFAASACFATPIGYQTNTYVYGAGGYKFTDFPRVGLLLNFILWIVATLTIPILFPFST